MDMAVGVIVGGAFTAIVTSLNQDILTPVLAIFGGTDFSNLYVKLGSGDTAPVLMYGNFITAVINFLITAFVIFCLVKFINKLGDTLHPENAANGAGGLLYYFYKLDELAILPSLIFMGVGAMTDFGPLIANPKSFLLGAAAQFGIFAAYFGAIWLGFNDKAAAAISIIGGADGPTSIFLAGNLGQTAILGPIAVAAYSYMSLVPIIQPPIMKLLTTEKERKIKMGQLRPVSKLEKILFSTQHRLLLLISRIRLY